MPNVKSEYIKIPAHDGGAFAAYIAYPDVMPAPAMILIQEIFGVNDEMQKKCHDYANQGYVAICPDLFWRIEPGIELYDSDEAQLQRAFELFGQFDIDLGMKDLKTTLGYIRNHKSCNKKAGCVGYCLGGKLAYKMAVETDIDAAVSYYGVGIETMLEGKSQIDHPLLMHIAVQDQFVPPDAQSRIIEGLSGHPMVTIHMYEEQDHAFARDNGMHFDAEAARTANERTAAFLKNILA